MQRFYFYPSEQAIGAEFYNVIDSKGVIKLKEAYSEAEAVEIVEALNKLDETIKYMVN